MATRWGIASAGKISHDFVTAIRALPENEHDVIAVAARDLSRAQDFAKLHNMKKAYNEYSKLAQDKDIDVIYIGTINTQHFDIAMLMLKHGKHVLCEKPLTLNLKQTTELINYAKSKKLFLMEAVWSRCFPIYDTIKKTLANGSIGDVHQVTVTFGFKLLEEDRISKKELGGGTILDLGIYVLQFASLIYNNEMPESIKATGFLNENGIDISMSATLLYKGNRTATVVTSGLVELQNEAVVCGTKGMIRVPQFWCPITADVLGTTVKTSLPKLKHDINFINSAGLCFEANEVRTCLQKDLLESPLVTHDTSLLLAKLEDEIRKQVGVVFPED